MIYPDFRELFDGSSFLAGINNLESKQYEFDRVYIGSSFCPFSFLYSDIYDKAIQYCSDNNKKISLSVPVFNQAALKNGKEKLNGLLEEGKDVIDEVIVNDIGMLRYMTEQLNMPVVMGRLFFKDPRDGRLLSFVKRTGEISLLSFSDFIHKNCVIGIEIDPITSTMDLSSISNYDGIVMLNGPYCYMSTGMICKFASVHKTVEQKFRPSAKCRLECRHMIEIHSDRFRSLNRKLIRAGRAIYFYQPDVTIIGRKADRNLYFPLDEYMQYLKR